MGEEVRNVEVERALVLLQRENIISFLGDDFPRDGLLRPDRVDGDDGAFDRRQVEKF
jgi:hypothetical protein